MNKNLFPEKRCATNPFPLRLKALRAIKKTSQAEVAACIGSSQSAFSQWENGASQPDARYVARLAEYYEVSADFLLGLHEKPKEYDATTEVIVSTGLSPKAVRTLCAWMQNPCEKTAFAYRVLEDLIDSLDHRLLTIDLR